MIALFLNLFALFEALYEAVNTIMSTASKAPRNRTLQYAGSSRLPIRLVCPTYNVRTKDSLANFVSSAHQMQKRKDFDLNERKAKIISKTYGEDRQKDIDCNHNEHNPSEINCSESANVGIIQQQHEEYYELQQPTVKTTSNLANSSQSTSDQVQSNGKDKTESASSIKLLKPGYFMQKIHSLKTSQLQKLSADSSRRKMYNSEGLKFGSRPVFKDSNELQEPEDTDSGKEQRHCAKHQFDDSNSSKFSRQYQKHSTDLPPTIENSTLTRSEKRKKYLELPSKISKGNLKKITQQNDASVLKPPMKLDGRNGYNGNGTDEKRDNLKKPPPRSAKIVRPVIRPKKTASPFTPRPFVAEYSTSKSKLEVKHRIGELPLPSVSIFHLSHEDGRKNEEYMQRRLSDKASNSTASKDKNQSFESTAYLDTRQATVENAASLSRANQVYSDTKTESCFIDDEGVNQKSGGCISNILEEESSPIEESYRNIGTRKPSTSSSGSSGEVRMSPDCEYTSESSLETVVSVARSLDGSNKELEENETALQCSEEGFNCETYTSKISLEILEQSFGVVNMDTLHTPYTSTLSALSPSTSSTSKPKKRRTDVSTSPFSVDCNHDFVQQNRSDTEKESEEKTLFSNKSDDNNDVDDKENEFSELHDASSLLHESDFMADYNSITEDDYNSDDAVDEEHRWAVGEGVIEKAPTNPKSSTATVSNELSCEGITKFEDTAQSSPCRCSAQHYFPFNKPEVDEWAVEVGMMKILLVKLRRTIEIEEAKRERQAEENKRLIISNKRLMINNDKLTKLVEEVREELESLKLQKEQVKTDVAKKECMEASSQTMSEAHKYRSEVSTEVESAIKQAAADMKVIHESFDGKVREVERRLHDAIGLFMK